VKNFLGNVPLGRLTDPTDVAKAALFLGKFLPFACASVMLAERSGFLMHITCMVLRMLIGFDSE
jgi:hypothetical protein